MQGCGHWFVGPNLLIGSNVPIDQQTSETLNLSSKHARALNLPPGEGKKIKLLAKPFPEKATSSDPQT
jgi:hypothetical protein